MIKVHCGSSLNVCGVVALQENIRDKLRGIPIDVSVKIQDANRKRRQTTAEMRPVLDANEPMTTREEVCVQNASEDRFSCRVVVARVFV